MEEERREEYLYLRNRMSMINAQLDVTVQSFNELLSELNNGIKIDNEIAYYNELKRDLDNLQNAKHEVQNIILPSINRKL